MKKLHDVEMLGILARGVAMGIADIVPGIFWEHDCPHHWNL